MAVAEKLALLRSTKSNIKAAIEEKGQEVGEIPFSQYPEKIRAIEGGGGGGGGGGASTPPDPEEVYKATRPTDWLPMPEPADNEMYLLVHIPDGASALLAFTVTCTDSGAPYAVTLGGVQNGQFAPNNAFPASKIYSGRTYAGELFADDWGDLTSDGFKQIVVKITGDKAGYFSQTIGVIETWEPVKHSKIPPSASMVSLPIMEISCRLPKGVAVRCGDSTGGMPLMKLRYFTWSGENAVTDMSNMFNGCYSLATIPQLDTSAVTNMSNMFEGCYSLAAIPQLDTSAVTNMSYMFEGCYSLTAIPQLDTSAVTNMSNMFEGCYSLTAIPKLDTSSVTDMYSMFGDCRALTAIPELDTSSVIDMGDMFYGCFSLSSIKLNPGVEDWGGADIDLSNCCLGHTAIVALFESLPTITDQAAIDLSGSYGAEELTGEEKAIATDKGWILDM